ncbi:MAG: O-antigen ligase family protein [Erythrobacter sp.]|nr:O-antigen ligase family protein [Erythrobacter sp.]
MSILGSIELGTLAVIAAIAGASVLTAWAISRASRWQPAGPLALLVAAALVPTVPIGFHVSTDDIPPLIGLGMLVYSRPWPGVPGGRLWRVGLGAVILAVVARVLASVANATGFADGLFMLAEGVGRPLFLLAAVAYVATTEPPALTTVWVVRFLALLGSFQAVVGLLAFALPLPLDVAVQPVRHLESLGGCPGRITGTLGLSPNHLGAIFVLTIPLSLSLGAAARGWQRWGWSAAAGFQAAALILTFTRSSLVLAAVACIVLLVYKWRTLIVGGAALAVAAMAVAAVTTFACAPSADGPGEPFESGAPSPDASAPAGPSIVDRFGDQSDRLALWYSGARMMLDYPVAGVGPGRMLEVMRSDPARYVHTPYGVSTSSAHNTILLAGAESGVLGALGLAVLNGVIALAAIRWVFFGSAPYAAAAAVAILAFLAQGMVNNLFSVPATSILLSLLVGAFVGAERSDRAI